MAGDGFTRRMVQWVGLLAGPLLAVTLYLILPESYAGLDGRAVPFTHAGRCTAAVAIWMAAWWMTEAIPVYSTSLLPLVLLPLTSSASISEASAPYAHELIFLFMGGFILALSMQRWGLHRRISLVALRSVGSEPRRIVGGFMAITALLSMWVSNTATAVLMLPIAVSVIDLVESDHAGQEGMGRNFALCLMLGIAYAASIGGIGTLIGTPPNLFLASYVKSHLGMEIGFARWMLIGVPLVAVFVPLVWWLLTRWLYPIRVRETRGHIVVHEMLAELGPMKRGEKITLVVFCLTAAAWIFRPLLVPIEWGGLRPFGGLTDPGIAMLAALALFVIPVDPARRIFVMDWETARRLPWGLLLLFGGGLSLARAIQVNGVGELIGHQVSEFAGWPPVLLVIGVTAMMIFLTELTSNTATTATLLPILAGLAPGLGLQPMLLLVPAAVAASCAFMLPVATPPNAVVFGSGRVTIPQMCRAGFWLNIIGIALVTLLTYAIALPVLAGGR